MPAAGSMIVILMGVAGTGKTTIGRLLGADLGWAFLDADDFHPPANVEKMRRGLPLTDADRELWLESLRQALLEKLARGESTVLACSALKEAYRARLRVDASVRFVHLKADPEVIRRRLEERRGHFFAPDLLASQLETLEESKDALAVDVAAAPETIVRIIEQALGLAPAGTQSPPRAD
jgi:gluconokinase